MGLQTTKTNHTLLWLTHLVAKIQQRGTCLFLTSYDEAVTLFLSVPTNWPCILSLNLSHISLVITSLHPHSVNICLKPLCYLLFLRSILHTDNLLASPLVTKCQILQSYCITFFCCWHYHATYQFVNSFMHCRKSNLCSCNLPGWNLFNTWYLKSCTIIPRITALVIIAGTLPRGWLHEAAAPSIHTDTQRMTGEQMLMRRLTFTSTRPPLCPLLLCGITVRSMGGTGSRLRDREK